MKRGAGVLLFSLLTLAAGCTGKQPDSAAPGTAPTSAPTPGTSQTTQASVSSLAAPAPGAPTPPGRDQANVDARAFSPRPGEYFFQSPSRTIMCGIYLHQPTLGVGCQSAVAAPPPQGPRCQPPNQTAVRIAQGAATQLCVNQGFYVGEPADGRNRGGGKVLNYGETLFAQSISCSSSEAGITCFAGAHGFQLSRDMNRVFRVR